MDMIETSARNIAVQRLWTMYHQEIQRYLYHHMRDRDTAEDLCQETFLRVLLAWDADVTLVNPRAWLYHIARNLTIDTIRKTARSPTTVSFDNATASLSSQLASEDVARIPVTDLLSPLEPTLQSLLVLHHLCGYTMDELAAQQGRTSAAMRLILFRARHRVRTLQGPHYRENVEKSMYGNHQ